MTLFFWGAGLILPPSMIMMMRDPTTTSIQIFGKQFSAHNAYATETMNKMLQIGRTANEPTYPLFV